MRSQVSSLVMTGLAAALAGGTAAAQTPGPTVETVVVTADRRDAYASPPQLSAPAADLGPLGTAAVLDAPQSVTTVPEDLIVSQQVRTVNDALRFLPSAEIRDQQGFEVSRPQSRGFQSSIAQNTRLDGLNVVGTTAIAAENLSEIQVLNGPSGALFGPESPAGVFDYRLKRPTTEPLLRYVESFQSQGVFTEQLDAGGTFGRVGARVNVVHGDGESYVDGSHVDRTLAAFDFDIHLDPRTVVELDYSHNQTEATGLPGSVVYDGASTSAANRSTRLPAAVDPTVPGYGQPGAGTNLRTETAVGKIKHSFNDDWTLEIGGLYQNAIRGLFGITNTLTDDRGDYTVTKNFTAIPQFTIGSNSAYLNGHVQLFGLLNDVSLGTNGFINGQYSHRSSIAVSLGSSNLADPAVLPSKPTPGNGGLYESGKLFEQSLIAADTLHLTPALAVQAVVNTSWLHSQSFSAAGVRIVNDEEDAKISPSVSVIYKPLPRLALHASWTQSIEQGDQATAGSPNANQFLAPYHDESYEVGAKYQLTPRLLLTLDAFHMTRPYATNIAPTNVFEVVGRQRNNGVELFGQGEVSPDLSVLGGMTYIDARLLHSDNPATEGRRIVGVPNYQTDVLFDLHPRIARGAALTLALNYESDRAATNTNGSFAPGFVTVDPGVRYTLHTKGHAVTARFTVVNATDARYYVSIADGNIVGSPGANTAYLGAPRTFLASLEADF